MVGNTRVFRTGQALSRKRIVEIGGRGRRYRRHLVSDLAPALRSSGWFWQ